MKYEGRVNVVRIFAQGRGESVQRATGLEGAF